METKERECACACMCFEMSKSDTLRIECKLRGKIPYHWLGLDIVKDANAVQFWDTVGAKSKGYEKQDRRGWEKWVACRGGMGANITPYFPMSGVFLRSQGSRRLHFRWKTIKRRQDIRNTSAGRSKCKYLGWDSAAWWTHRKKENSSRLKGPSFPKWGKGVQVWRDLEKTQACRQIFSMGGNM